MVGESESSAYHQQCLEIFVGVKSKSVESGNLKESTSELTNFGTAGLSRCRLHCLEVRVRVRIVEVGVGLRIGIFVKF